MRTDSTLPSMILNEIGNAGQIKRKYYQRVLPENASKDYYYIMRDTPNTTALLIEYGFIDNLNDQRKIKNNLIDYAEAVVKAVTNYIGIPYKKTGQQDNAMPLPFPNTYVVQKDDTLYQIAIKFNTTVDEIKNLNNLTNNTLQIGQILNIPTNEQNLSNSNQQNQYIVEAGDTLYKIANQFNTSIDELIEYNQLPTTILTIGQILKIPKSVTSNVTHTVQSGDTLYKIANEYGVTIEKLKEINNLTSNTLSIGQELYIPENIDVEQTDYVVYQVQPGDTLYSIAIKYKTTPENIKEYNQLNSNLLTINQILQIPTEEITSENIAYTVKRGDTLYKIANNYGSSVQEIMNLNNLNSTILSIGQTILIPKQVTDFDN